ncbi:MAG: aspartate/glutamate racemase family protein [Lawsonibacter sp.]
MHGKLIETYYPILHTSSFCITDQPRGVCDLETKNLAVPKIIALAKMHPNADAIVVSCCDDPAVEELKKELSIPVIGAGSSVCAVARCIGNRIGVIGITEYVPEVYKQILGNSLLDLGRPDGITCTQDLMTDEGRKSVLCKAQELSSHGADCIALACTGMSTIRISRDLENQCGIPVIDPVMAEGLFAYYACLRNDQ